MIEGIQYLCCASCMSAEDYESYHEKVGKFDLKSICSFGIHPQFISENNDGLDLLKKLAADKRIGAIGEIGFDFFTEESKLDEKNQARIFERQLQIALENSLPVVLHLRKAFEKIFTYSDELSKLPSVVFHSFPGTLNEAQYFLKKGVNAYFSFGKAFLKGKKSSLECVAKLPEKRILFETDAPFQPVSGKKIASPEDIMLVYRFAYQTKYADQHQTSFSDFCALIAENFMKAFRIEV